MGKYTRKSKLTGDVVAVMDISHSTLGVRTRATTLALQKLQALKTPAATPPPELRCELSYLQLRSRKLEKPPLPQSTCCSQRNPNPNSGCLKLEKLEFRACGSGSHEFGSGHGDVSVQDCDLGAEEASFGENNLDSEAKERSTRESTPCSFIRDSNDSITPGSSTRHAIVPNSIQRIMPSAQEIEEFFARHALEQQRLFSEKYNFDIVNEKPLQGRYEWVKVDI
ncbi:putative cyclin-dependent kinase inhibitor [Helianthus annuus]|nr:putative cyclin-dependent kinase inhibitor [Helianthus annuus]